MLQTHQSLMMHLGNMNNSGGRFALPALFPAVRKFFDTPLPDGT
jgi:hypothetical protein